MNVARLGSDLAIDLGTANTCVFARGRGVVVSEPSIVALDRTTGKVLAVGKQAMMMHGKTHENIKTVRPLKDGVIADFEAAEQMIKGMIRMISSGNRLFSPSLKMVICIPSGITEVEKRAVRDEGMAQIEDRPAGIAEGCHIAGKGIIASQQLTEISECCPHGF